MTREPSLVPGGGACPSVSGRTTHIFGSSADFLTDTRRRDSWPVDALSPPLRAPLAPGAGGFIEGACDREVGTGGGGGFVDFFSAPPGRGGDAETGSGGGVTDRGGAEPPMAGGCTGGRGAVEIGGGGGVAARGTVETGSGGGRVGGRLAVVAGGGVAEASSGLSATWGTTRESMARPRSATARVRTSARTLWPASSAASIARMSHRIASWPSPFSQTAPATSRATTTSPGSPGSAAGRRNDGSLKVARTQTEISWADFPVPTLGARSCVQPERHGPSRRARSPQFHPNLRSGGLRTVRSKPVVGIMQWCEIVVERTKPPFVAAVTGRLTS